MIMIQPPSPIRAALILAAIALGAAGHGQFVDKGTIDSVQVAYRWAFPKGQPELLLRLRNTASMDRQAALTIDLFYQGRTIETFEADTCIRASQALTGKLNGIYFRPKRITAAQVKDGSAEVDVTRTEITASPCP